MTTPDPQHPAPLISGRTRRRIRRAYFRVRNRARHVVGIIPAAVHEARVHRARAECERLRRLYQAAVSDGLFGDRKGEHRYWQLRWEAAAARVHLLTGEPVGKLEPSSMVEFKRGRNAA